MGEPTLSKKIHAASQTGRHKKKAGGEQAKSRPTSLSQRERERRKSKRAVIRFHLKY